MPAVEPDRLAGLLEACAALHRQRLCPRQVLGVRMGMYAGELLGLNLPQSDKRLLAIVEMDGCAADGIGVATGCWVGRRTMRIEDYGKVAATFVATQTRSCLRLWPSPQARDLAWRYAPGAGSSWEAQLLAYQLMPPNELFCVRPVNLAMPLELIMGQPGGRVNCQSCGEEILNARQVLVGGKCLCRSCAGLAYYTDSLPSVGGQG
ncbi:MAG: FmdE family protein [Anaerolineales bacterium]|nr:FmdE family protein [Anaerolineales bacterium]